jgi:hypothetical protein
VENTVQDSAQQDDIERIEHQKESQPARLSVGKMKSKQPSLLLRTILGTSIQNNGYELDRHSKKVQRSFLHPLENRFETFIAIVMNLKLLNGQLLLDKLHQSSSNHYSLKRITMDIFYLWMQLSCSKSIASGRQTSKRSKT